MNPKKRIVIAGATGMIGSRVAPMCAEQGYEVVVLSRDPGAAAHRVPGAADYLPWRVEPPQPGMAWVKAIDGAYAVINCAGESLFTQRYTKAYARQAQATRIEGTQALTRAIALAANRPQAFIVSSSQGVYGFTDEQTDRPLGEDAPLGRDDWAQGNAEWEAAANEAPKLGVRTVWMRTSYVLGPEKDGGLAQQIGQFRKGQGALTTPTEAWVSWIHILDEARLFLFALDDARVAGPLNCTAPNPIRKREFAQLLSVTATGKETKRVMPGRLLKLFMGKAAEIWLYGKPVIPAKALALGFQFRYPTIQVAVADLAPQIG